ncbi:TonB-dependent siderophore receptor [Croceicoccus sp. F390]|uniref:TonB-dependent siderophore receptor n=1 Tax=Croceicoccus esteveae TaxID=3075597 RepID=A0ABU2ZF69_9SPHN|nr:TonB-dependent siderophore receptor [Croceicoccus sp. F390]MDT0574728.1 TonB-dependent siderophore receptor [Croceicoccus sp. F390]
MSYLALGCIGFVASAHVSPAIAAQATPARLEGEPRPAATRLEGVTVTDAAVQDGYLAEELASPKITAPVVDTPRIVNVVTEKVLEDTASFSFEDALRTVPGITLGAGEGGTANADIPLIRGVDATGDVFIDGVRDIGSQAREIFAIERIEVFKGPSSAFGGRGAAAGAINIVTKQAREGNFGTATATAGTDDLLRLSVDGNAQLADRLAVRLAAVYHDADTPGRDAVQNERWGVAPSLTWGLGSPTTATLGYYHYETDGIPDYGIPLTSREQLPGGERVPADVDYDNFYGLLARDFQKTKVDSATFSFEHVLGNGWVLSDVARYSRARNNYIVTNPDDSAGNVANSVVWRAVKSRNSTSDSFANNLNLAGVLDTGSIAHSLSLGVEFGVADAVNRPYAVDTGNRTCPEASFEDNNCTSLADPDPSDPWTGSIAPGARQRASASDVSIYAFDTITVLPQLLVNAGIRYTAFDTDAKGTSRGVAYDVEANSDFLSYQGGVVFKPSELASLYFSYANAKTPPGTTIGEGSVNINGSNAFYEPQTTENWEVGGKAQIFNGALLLSAAAFQVDRDNIIDDDPITGAVPVADKARLRGFELGASGRAGPVSIFAGYTFVDSELRDGSDNDGNSLPNTPRNNLAVTGSWQVSPRFEVGGGVYHASKRYADPANLISADGYWRFDANASYELTDSLGIRVNVQNIGDERYIKKLRNPHFGIPSDGRQALVSLIARY